jgi:hypothetical protein
MVPSNISAANATVSDRVGRGCTVRPMSSAYAPISIANAASAIRSPAFGPTMPQPSRRLVASSNSSLVTPSSRPSDKERPLAAHGNTPLSYLTPFVLGLVLGHPDRGDLGVGIGGRWDYLGVEEAVALRRRLGCDLAFVRRLVGQHRLADDVADREDVRHVGVLLAIHRDEPALADAHTGVLRPDQPSVRTPADGASMRANLSDGGALPPSNEATSPSGVASDESLPSRPLKLDLLRWRP